MYNYVYTNFFLLYPMLIQEGHRLYKNGSFQFLYAKEQFFSRCR